MDSTRTNGERSHRDRDSQGKGKDVQEQNQDRATGSEGAVREKTVFSRRRRRMARMISIDWGAESISMAVLMKCNDRFGIMNIGRDTAA